MRQSNFFAEILVLLFEISDRRSGGLQKIPNWDKLESAEYLRCFAELHLAWQSEASR
jgi:hypothetical protein